MIYLCGMHVESLPKILASLTFVKLFNDIIAKYGILLVNS